MLAIYVTDPLCIRTQALVYALLLFPPFKILILGSLTKQYLACLHELVLRTSSTSLRCDLDLLELPLTVYLSLYPTNYDVNFSKLPNCITAYKKLSVSTYKLTYDFTEKIETVETALIA